MRVALDGLPDARFVAWYVRQLKWVLLTFTAIGLIMQLSLSFKLAPSGSRSRAINTAYIVAAAIVVHAVRSDDAEQSAWVLAGIGPALLICTRVIRAGLHLHGSPMDAAEWLSLGRDRPVSKCGGAMLMGLILTCSSVGQPTHVRFALILACEACRLVLVLLATLRAGCTRRVVDCALMQAASGLGAYAAGTALAGLHEASVRRLWTRNVGLERCTSMQARSDHECLIDLYSGLS